MQDFGNKAKPVLSELIFGKTVTVQKVGTDRYCRTIAAIQIDGKDVATAMVKAGFAWEYKTYSQSQTLANLEAEAREARRSSGHMASRPQRGTGGSSNGPSRSMELTFKVDQVEILIGYTKELLFEGADHRRGFDEPGLILASQFGAGVYLMSSLVDGEDDWTGRLVFAELCNPSEADYVEGVAGGRTGTKRRQS